jgi:hypothetical protein
MIFQNTVISMKCTGLLIWMCQIHNGEGKSELIGLTITRSSHFVPADSFGQPFNSIIRPRCERRLM